MKSKTVLGIILLVMMMSGHLMLNAEQVSALGRLLPANGVINIWGAGDAQVEAIHTKQGDWVKKGDLLVTLSNKEQLKSEVSQARKLLEQAEQTLEMEKRFQKVKLDGLKGDLENAISRLEKIEKNKTIASPQIIEERRQTVSTTKNELALAEISREKAILSLSQDIELKRFDLEVAERLAESAEIRSPVDGKVLIVRIEPGNVPGNGEIMKIADTSKMIVSAEVYESDINRVAVGQSAIIKSVAFEGEVTGTVVSKGHMIFKQSVDSLDPRSLSNSRVVEVQIEIDDAKLVEDLIYLQVDVFIKL